MSIVMVPRSVVLDVEDMAPEKSYRAQAHSAAYLRRSQKEVSTSFNVSVCLNGVSHVEKNSELEFT